MTDLLHFDYIILLRLVAAVLLGGIIGLERGGNNHEAGLRTHIILCLGASSVMVISECLIKQYGVPEQILRMGAQVISGVGFLGVGSIITDGNKVRGITTAAGLWTTACVGLVVGSGYYIIAASIVVLMMFTMLGLRSVTNHLKKKSKVLFIRISLEDMDDVKAVLKELMDKEVDIKNVKLEELNDEIEMVLEVRTAFKLTNEDLMYSQSAFGGIKEFTGL